MDEPTFLALADSQPRMMIELCLRAVSRAQSTRWHSAPSTVLAIVGAKSISVQGLVDGLVKELRQYGKVHRLSPEIVDAALETPGIFDVARGEVGDVRVSRMVHELELESDHLIVEVGDASGPWSRRALGMADRVLIVVPPTLYGDEADYLDDLLGGCPVAVRRSVVIVRPDRSRAPTESSQVTEKLQAADAFNISAGSSSDIARLARISVGRANAMVLSGGGGRGFAHIGVYRALTELGFPVDLVGGTSIGGIIGSVIADALAPDEIVEWAHDHFPNALDYTIPIVSLTKGNRIARSARTTFGDRDIEDLWRTYFAVSTDLTSSRTRIHKSGSIALAIRATSAIPGVMPPVPDGDSLLIDGGVLNNLPIDIARTEAPAGKIVAVDVAPPRGPGAHSDYGLSVSGWEALRSTIGSGRSRYPRISAVLMRSMITASMLERDNQISSGLADCYLDLDMRGVSMLEFNDPTGVSRRGYEAAMPELESWMGSLSEI
jgi:predicted acylesterase/phospholipase RssA